MDFEGINHINKSVLSKYKKIDINNSNINKYKSSCKGLSHVRTGSDYKGVIYLDEENVVGFYNIRLSDNYLQGIEINKEYQSNGLGRALLNESIKNGVINLSVNKNNDKAINMYKKDFKIIDEDNNMYYMRLKSYKEVSESTNIDKLLVWFEKPIDKLLNKNIKLYHGSSVNIKGKVIDPISINVGATKLSNPRWSTYFWDNKEMAIQWAITWEVRDKINTNCLYRNHDGKTLLVNNTNLSDEKFIDKILSKKPSFYIYETEVPISKLEMGSTAAMPEYTVSETIKIIKKTKINVTRQMIYDYFEIISKDEGDKVIDPNDMDYMSRYRNKFLDLILSNYRDSYRYLIKRDVKKGEIKVGDDISNYRNKINKALDDDLLGLRPKKESSEEITNEGYLLSKDNLYINFDKFESGKSNICLITGLSGSGKSTLGKQLASKYNAEYVELDTFEHNYLGVKGVVKEYLEKNNLSKLDMDELYQTNPEVFHKELSKFMDWVIPRCQKDKSHKYILEGVQIYSHGDINKIKGKPIIFVNTSVSKSIIQRYKRDYNGYTTKELLYDLKEGLPDIVKWYLGEYKQLNKFKKKINYETLQYQEKQYSTFDTINDLPYFLPNKLEEFSNYYTNLKEDTEWQESYNDLSVNLIDRNEFIDINKERINKLNELYYK